MIMNEWEKWKEWIWVFVSASTEKEKEINLQCKEEMKFFLEKFVGGSSNVEIELAWDVKKSFFFGFSSIWFSWNAYGYIMPFHVYNHDHTLP